MSGGRGAGGGSTGTGTSSTSRRHHFRKLLHKNAASVWSSSSSKEGASTSTTQAIARRAVEREFQQQQQKNRGGGAKKRGRKVRGGEEEDDDSSDDDGDDDDAKRKPHKASAAAAKEDPEGAARPDQSPSRHKYRDRAKERREGKVTRMTEVDGDEGEEEEDGSDSSDGVTDHDAHVTSGGTPYRPNDGDARRSLDSTPLLLARTKEQALKEVLPTLVPSSGLGREVLAYLRRRHPHLDDSAGARGDNNNNNNNGAPPLPTPAGRAVQRSTLRFANIWTACDPRDVAQAWQLPIEITSSSSSSATTATDRDDARGGGQHLLGPDLIRQIDEALKRRMFSTAAAAFSSSVKQDDKTNEVRGAEGGRAPSHSASTPSDNVFGGDVDGDDHDDEKDDNDDDDDDIFGNVGEYNPDDDDDGEEHEAKGNVETGEGPSEGADREGASDAAPAASTSASAAQPDASATTSRRRALFGDVLASVPVTTATASSGGGARPGAGDIAARYEEVEGEDEDRFDDANAAGPGRRRRLAGLAEAVDGYGDDLDAEYTGQYDDDDDDDEDDPATNKDVDTKKTKKKKRARKKKKSVGSDSE